MLIKTKKEAHLVAINCRPIYFSYIETLFLLLVIFHDVLSMRNFTRNQMKKKLLLFSYAIIFLKWPL